MAIDTTIVVLIVLAFIGSLSILIPTVKSYLAVIRASGSLVDEIMESLKYDGKITKLEMTKIHKKVDNLAIQTKGALSNSSMLAGYLLKR